MFAIIHKQSSCRTSRASTLALLAEKPAEVVMSIFDPPELVQSQRRSCMLPPEPFSHLAWTSL